MAEMSPSPLPPAFPCMRTSGWALGYSFAAVVWLLLHCLAHHAAPSVAALLLPLLASCAIPDVKCLFLRAEVLFRGAQIIWR